MRYSQGLTKNWIFLLRLWLLTPQPIWASDRADRGAKEIITEYEVFF
jgi:hypothetical protein